MDNINPDIAEIIDEVFYEYIPDSIIGSPSNITMEEILFDFDYEEEDHPSLLEEIAGRIEEEFQDRLCIHISLEAIDLNTEITLGQLIDLLQNLHDETNRSFLDI